MKCVELMLKIHILFVTTLTFSSAQIIFCYYSLQSYRQGFTIKYINPDLCTHIAFAFVGMNRNGAIELLDETLDIEPIRNTQTLKANNPNLNILVSVSGWHEEYSSTTEYHFKVLNFIASAILFMKEYKFDGLDLYLISTEIDHDNIIILLKELNKAFSSLPYLLTASIDVTNSLATSLYDFMEMSQHLDYINVRSFNFHKPLDRKLVHNSALRGKRGGYDTVASVIEFMLSKGVPAHKLIMGIPVFGRNFTLTNPSRTRIGSASVRSRNVELLAYYEICNLNQDWTKKWDEVAQVPYTYKDNQWITYDNVKSITAKIEYLKSKNLGGAMIWSIDLDDYRGTCGGGIFPLLRTVNYKLNNQYERNCQEYENFACYCPL